MSQIADQAKMKEDTKKAFSNYVEELKREKEKGKISAEDYRELIMKWCKDNKI